VNDNKIEQRSKDLTDKWNQQAEEALAAADLSAMRQLVQEAAEVNKKYAQAFNGMIQVFKPSLDRSPESESAIAAMREVALAAIDLAKHFTQKIEGVE
jgi:hypothetical protein